MGIENFGFYQPFLLKHLPCPTTHLVLLAAC
jgi:hypothetical protein